MTAEHLFSDRNFRFIRPRTGEFYLRFRVLSWFSKTHTNELLGFTDVRINWTALSEIRLIAAPPIKGMR